MDFKKILKKIQLDKLKKMDFTKMNKNTVLMVVAILCVLVTVVLVVMNLSPSDQSIAKASVDYINNNLLQGQGTATLGTVSRDSGLIKFQITVSGQTFDSYATKDGKLFFPQAFNLKNPPKAPSGSNTTGSSDNNTPK